MMMRSLISSLIYEERNRFVLWLPVLFAVGIGSYFGLESEPDTRSLAVMTLGFASLSWIMRRRFWLRLVAVALLAISAGAMIASLRSASVEASYLYSAQFFKEVSGRVDDIAVREKDRKLYITDLSIEGIQKKTTPKRVSIALRKPAPGLKVGDLIQVKAMLFPPPDPAMPGAYDFGRKFYYEKLGAVGYTPYVPELVQAVGISNFDEWLNDLRLKVAERIRSVMEADTGAVASAIMVGEQSAISDEVRESMRDSGLYHVLSISGLHMSLAVGILYFSLRLLLSLYMPLALRFPVKKIAACMGLLGAFCYLLLAGYPVPAVRSFIMVACVMLAVMFDRRGISVFSLCWAALIILLFRPESLVGASFQLSFAATLAIVVLYERYSHVLYQSDMGWFRALRLYFFGLMATSLVATLATTPLVVHLFGRMTIWGLAANMLMMPLASFWIMPAAVVSFLAMPFGLEAWPLAILEQSIAWMLDVSRWFSSLPYAATILSPLTHWGMLLVVLGGLWLCIWERRWKWFGVPLMLIGVSTSALYQPYDLIVNDEGKRVLIRQEDGQFVFLRGKVDSFESKLWLQTMGQETALTLKEIKRTKKASGCDKNRCHLTLHGVQLAISLRKNVTDLCLPETDIVITENYLKDDSCKHVQLKIDRRFLRRYGAAALRLREDKPILDVVATRRGGRPWGKRVYWPLYQTDKPAMMLQDKLQKDDS